MEFDRQQWQFHVVRPPKSQAFSAVRWALAGLACVVTNPWQVCPKSPLKQKGDTQFIKHMEFTVC